MLSFFIIPDDAICSSKTCVNNIIMNKFRCPILDVIYTDSFHLPFKFEVHCSLTYSKLIRWCRFIHNVLVERIIKHAYYMISYRNTVKQKKNFL